MSRSCFAVSVLLVLAVTASAIAPTDEEPQDRRVLIADVHLKMKEAAARLAAAGMKVASARAAEKKDGGVATQGDDQSSSSGSGGASSGSEHGKEEGNNKEGGKEKQARSCLSKECHKKRLLCGKGCTLSAHTKCAAKCSKSCIPTC